MDCLEFNSIINNQKRPEAKLLASFLAVIFDSFCEKYNPAHGELGEAASNPYHFNFMQHYYLYILECSDGSYYVGHTDNLEKRLAEHSSGQFLGYTSSRLPIKLMFSEVCYSRDEAFTAEHKIKRWTRRKKQYLMNYGWAAMEQYSQE